MREGAGCTRRMDTGPSDYCTIRAHVALDIPPPLPERREIGAFLPRPGFKPTTLTLTPLLEQHHLTSPPKIRR
jgi:hypothetical protein